MGSITYVHGLARGWDVGWGSLVSLARATCGETRVGEKKAAPPCPAALRSPRGGRGTESEMPRIVRWFLAGDQQGQPDNKTMGFVRTPDF